MMVLMGSRHARRGRRFAADRLAVRPAFRDAWIDPRRASPRIDTGHAVLFELQLDLGTVGLGPDAIVFVRALPQEGQFTALCDRDVSEPWAVHAFLLARS
jgi:hypothetical protein